MNEEKIQERIEEAMNPEEFDVLDYLEGQPIAEETITIYTHVPSARKLSTLVEQRTELLKQRRAAEVQGKASSLSLTDEEEDTEYDDEINALVETLEKTALIFHTQTVAPALVRAINKKYEAKFDKSWDDEKKQEHEQKRVADILTRAIAKVTLGNGAVDPKPWTIKRLREAEEKLYDEQAQRLIGHLYGMVFTGQVFDEALTSDFS